MRVLFDISVLAWGERRPEARTGIYRAVRAIAEGLCRAPDCDLMLYAGCQPWSLQDCRDYVRASEPCSGTPVLPVVPPSLGLWPPRYRSEPLTGMRELVRSRNPTRILRDLRLSSRVTGRVATWGEQALQAYGRLVERQVLRRTEVFHSPFLPIPAIVREFTHLSTLITVYDLVPFLFPQLAEAGAKALVRSALAGLTERDWVICVSESTRDDLCNLFRVHRERTFVTHLAADADTFHRCIDADAISAVRRKYGIPPGEYLLSLNTIEPRKNVKGTIEAFGRLVQQERVSDLCLVLVGPCGWSNADIYEAVRRSNEIGSRVIVTGYAADEDLAALYSGALCFVYPSLYEGFGLPPLEAMQCGVPVIASNTSSLPEVVGDAGILVPPTDTDAICQAMLSVYRDPGLRSALAAKSLQRAKQFTWEKCVSQTMAAYQHVISGG